MPQAPAFCLRRLFLTASLCAAAFGGDGPIAGLVAQPAQAAEVATKPARPNVLFLVLEDVSPERFGLYGNKVCRTPNIDRLASQGMRFDRFYTTPPCCPARTSMITGLRPETTRVFDNGDAKLNRELFARTTLLPEQFKSHGYETVRIGKFAHDDVKPEIWSRIVTRGEGREEEERKDEERNGPASKGDGDREKAKQRPSEKHAGKPPQGPHSDPQAKFVGARFLYGPTGLADHDHDDYHTAGAAVKVLKESRTKPLFLAVGFHADHLPFRAPDAYFAMYPAGQMTIPHNAGAEADGMPTKKSLNAVRKVSGFNAMGFNNPATLDEWRAAIAAQYACLSFVDAQVGRVLQALDEAGRADDTIVLLWSDHGFLLGEHFMWRKGLLYDANCRSAFVVRAPGKTRAGGVCGRIVETADLFPTLVDLCGLPRPEHCEGLSFAPLLAEPDRPWKQGSLIYRDAGRSVGLTTERWRYNRHADDPTRDALYDHDTDPGEQTNLLRDPQHAALLKELGEKIDGGWKGLLPTPR